MRLKLIPGGLRGEVTPPPSKSQAHRAIIAAALAKGESRVAPLSASMDIRATLACMEALGASYCPETGVISGIQRPPQALPELLCAESGSTLRFLIPVALALCGGGVFVGRGRLMQRPQAPYFDLFREKGIRYEQAGDRLIVQGTLPPGRYALPGDVSSQFITGLLFALPLLPGACDIVIQTPLQSRDYVVMTLQVLAQFGIRVEQENLQHFHIPGGQVYQPAAVSVESDYSQAAFFATAQALGNPVKLLGLNPNSAQGDRVIFAILEQLAQGGPQEVDVSQCPDLVPAIALRAALRPGETTVIANAARLRAKESDRLAAVTQQLSALGAQLEEGADWLKIQGVRMLSGGQVDSVNDHRIAMMLAIAATRANRPVLLSGAESVEKSYPDFWAVYQGLGGRYEQLESEIIG